MYLSIFKVCWQVISQHLPIDGKTHWNTAYHGIGMSLPPRNLKGALRPARSFGRPINCAFYLSILTILGLLYINIDYNDRESAAKDTGVPLTYKYHDMMYSNKFLRDHSLRFWNSMVHMCAHTL